MHLNYWDVHREREMSEMKIREDLVYNRDTGKQAIYK